MLIIEMLVTPASCSSLLLSENVDK